MIGLSVEDSPAPDDGRRVAVVGIANTLTRVALLVDMQLEELQSEPLTPRAREAAAALGPISEILSGLQPELGRLGRKNA